MPLPVVPASSLTAAGFKQANQPAPSTQPIPASAGQAPAGQVPTYGAAGIFTGYAPIGGQPTPATPTNANPSATPTTVVPPTVTTPVTTPAPTTNPPAGTGTPVTAPQPVGTVTMQGNTQMVTGTDGTARPAYNTYYKYTDPATGTVSYTTFGGQTVQDPTNGGTNTSIQVLPATQPPVAGQTPSTTPPVGSTGTGNSTVDAINAQIADETSQYNQQLGKLNDQSDAAYTQLETQISQIENGTYPLTPAQQSQVDALNQQTQMLRQQQTIANSTYQNGVLLNEYLTGQAAPGEISGISDLTAAVSSGIQKIQDIDTKAAAALATMESGFESDNLKLVEQAYSDFSTYQASKEKTLNDMQSATVAAQQKLADQIITTTQNNITNILNAEKETFAEKDAAAKNAISQAQLTETAKKDAEDYQVALQKNNLDAMIAGLVSDGKGGYMPNPNTTSSNSTPVTMTANNIPDPAAQAAFLAKLPTDVATLIKGIANYQINPNSLPTRNYKGVGSLTQSQVLTLVAEYDPSFSQQNYSSRQALQTNFTSGKYSQNINSLNTAIGHISDIQSNVAGLGNAGFTPYNAAKNLVMQTFGSGAPAKAALNISAATSEIASTFKGTGATDEEIKALGVLSNDSSPDQVKAYIETATQLLSSRLQALTDTYTAGMGKAPSTSFLSPTSVNSLLQLKKSGMDIQVPALADAPQVKLQTFHDVSSQNASLIDQLVAADPTLKNDPQKMIDTLAQNGIEL
jgi:hypothetical protein